MRYSFTGKEITVSEALKDRVVSKISRLEKLFPADTEIFVTFSVVKLAQTIEVTIPLHKRTLRAEVTKEDLYSAIDEVVDVLEKQMVKYKTRLRDRSRRDAKFTEEYKLYFNDSKESEETEPRKIERAKKFDLKPMDAEEAIMEMELLGHSFYAFRNGETEEVNVVYKRKNGSYGVIELEY